MVKVIQVIFSDLKTAGNGKDDPLRKVTEIYDFDGKLIASNDPLILYSAEDCIRFALFVSQTAKGKSACEIENLFSEWLKKRE